MRAALTYSEVVAALLASMTPAPSEAIALRMEALLAQGCVDHQVWLVLTPSLRAVAFKEERAEIVQGSDANTVETCDGFVAEFGPFGGAIRIVDADTPTPTDGDHCSLLQVVPPVGLRDLLAAWDAAFYAARR